MNKLSKEKRNQLIMAITGIVVVLGGLYWGMIKSQYQSLAQISSKRADKVAELQRRANALKSAVANAAQYRDMAAQLTTAESDIVTTGDYYSWSYDLIRRFKANYKVEIPSITEPVVSEVDLIPQFPYRQIRLTVTGTAYYHDLGKFLADFENTYPHIRVTNLTMEPTANEAQKLTFHFDIVALVKATS